MAIYFIGRGCPMPASEKPSGDPRCRALRRAAMLALCAAGPALPFPIFSLDNRYEFKPEVYDSIAAGLNRDTVPWLSLPCGFATAGGPRFIVIKSGQQEAGACMYGMDILDWRAGGFNNGFFGGQVSYSSPHIRGGFSFDVHSCNRARAPSLVDSLDDLKPLQTINTYAHISGTGSKAFNFLYGYVEADAGPLAVKSGRYPLRWGPGRKGTLALSGTGQPPFHWYDVRLDFGTLFRASAFLSQYDDQYSFVPESTAVRAERYCAANRLDVRLGRHVQVGFYEFADFNGSDLLGRFANPLQLYYVSSYLGRGLPVGRVNLLGGLDVNAVFAPWRFYGELLNDDIKVTADSAPQKFAFQLGGAWYGKGTVKEAGAEYTHVSAETYGHAAPGLNRHVYSDEPAGWPWGNDQDLWHARARLQAAKNVLVNAEINWRVKGKGTLLDYYGDIPDSLRTDLSDSGSFVDYRNARHVVSFRLECRYAPLEQVDASLAWQPSLFRGKMLQRLRCALILYLPALREIKIP
ncbi:MAG: hypothetical protein JW699_00965 [Chitinispirillaceae bacterium]|nr:hypothetical protein [Chitinispirillaceae bacterium]